MFCLLQNLACKVEWLLSEKNSVESKLEDLLTQKEALDVRLKDAENRMKELESRLQEEKFNKLYQLLGMLMLNLSSVHDMKIRSGLCCNWT
jgi:chaperonin cofactor prefoldin